MSDTAAITAANAAADTATYTALADRGVLAVGGGDALAFLQNLVTNDIEPVRDGAAVYAALLTPQGKYLFDFFIVEADGRLLLDAEAERASALARRLAMYKLRADVTIEDWSGAWAVAAAFGGPPAPGRDGEVIAFTDPRLAAAGLRVLGPGDAPLTWLRAQGCAETDPAAYDAHRLALGLPDGSRDFAVENSFLLENNFEELNGVDFAKGCFVGQELTARTKHRGLVRKRLVPVRAVPAMPPPDTVIEANGREVGIVRSGRDQRGIAMLRLERVAAARAAGEALRAGDAELTPEPPDWLAPALAQ